MFIIITFTLSLQIIFNDEVWDWRVFVSIFFALIVSEFSMVSVLFREDAYRKTSWIFCMIWIYAQVLDSVENAFFSIFASKSDISVYFWFQCNGNDTQHIYQAFQWDSESYNMHYLNYIFHPWYHLVCKKNNVCNKVCINYLDRSLEEQISWFWQNKAKVFILAFNAKKNHTHSSIFLEN